MKPQNPPSRARSGIGTAIGCGGVVLVLVAVVAVVGFLIASLSPRFEEPSAMLPIPDDVPPAAATPAPNIDIQRDGRTSLQLGDWARDLSERTGISYQALLGYGNAEVIARQSRPECHISWNTLAGIGYVETMHGTYDGKEYGRSHLNDAGMAEPGIFGPRLDGKDFARIEDTDDGTLDGDKEFDRAVGPMQFIPESWNRYGVDANGDGEANPQNIDDAAASAVRLLCDHDRDLGTPEGWTQAIRSYNMSDEYVRNVRDAAASYAMGQPPMFG